MTTQRVEIELAAPTVRGRAAGFLRGTAGLVRRKPIGAASLAFLLLVAVVAIFANVIAPYGATDTSLGARFAPISGAHYFGADDFGRDVYSRVLVGSRIALLVGFSSVLLGMTVGSLIGVVSGYAGGTFDLIVQRFVDTLIALPNLVLAVTLVAVAGQSLFFVILAIAATLMPGPARIMRGQALAVKESQYIEAARALGATTPRVIFRHIVPQVVPLYIIVAASSLGTAILLEASLSFLGLGPPPPTVSWGGMLSGTITRFIQKSPWMAVFPGLAITLTVLAVNLLGDTMRDVLDPRLRR